MKKYNYFLIFILILIATAFIRFSKLGEIPPGLNIDEASQGYNAYSLLLTGKDRYGEKLPILFRSFGSFQPPIYTYLTVIPIKIFGPTIFSVHLVSALSGIGIILITFFVVYLATRNAFLSLVSMAVLSFSPWMVFFSRTGTEAMTGIFFFLLGLLFLVVSLKKSVKYFPLACLILGISTHAYYSERIVDLLFLISFIFIFHKVYFKDRRWFVTGIIILVLTQIPHLMMMGKGAFSRRLMQVNYFDINSFLNNSGNLRYLPFGRIMFILREFFSQYSAYFSPKNLFFDPDPQGARSLPDLSVFYSLFFVPFLFGIKAIVINSKNLLTKIIILIAVIGPIPAALTFDPFYTLRVLVFLWGIGLIISLGAYEICRLKPILIKYLFAVLFVPSLFALYKSTFILTKYERSEVYGYSYIKLLEETDKYPQKHFIVDSPRDLGTGIRLVFFKKYNPVDLQNSLKERMKTDYYSSIESEELYSVGNVEVRSINWEKDACGENNILVGDLLAFSETQINEHHLKIEFIIKDLSGETRLRAYSTQPKDSCFKKE